MEPPPTRPAAPTQRKPPRKQRAPPAQPATASGTPTPAASAALSNSTNGTPRAINGETATTAAPRNGNQRNAAPAGRGRNTNSRRTKPLSSAGAATLANGDALPRAPRAPRPKIPLTDTNGLNPAAPEWTPSRAGTEGGAGELSAESNNNKPRKRRPRNRIHKSVLDSANAAEDLTGSLIEGISDGSYECMICYDSVKHRDSVWSCSCCYAVFHLKCVEKWGKRSAEDNYRAAQASNASSSDAPAGWRCPGCQNVCKDIPTEYRCYCEKQINPPHNRFIMPHSCGDVCGRDRNCPHRCPMQCHPGPCRPCESMAPPVVCYCGKSKFTVRCSELASVTFSKTCGDVCGNPLACGLHTCAELCHGGPCGACPVVNVETCKCGKTTREVPCGTLASEWACGEKCDFVFPCGIHHCERDCHAPGTHPALCPFDPKVVTRCPCGNKTTTELLGGDNRTSCTDPIPTCEAICQKVLPCEHRCAEACHAGECPPCTAEVVAPCRCGREIMEGFCAEILRDENGKVQTPLCDRICQTQRHCKRHRCNERCCDLNFHVCELPCAKTLKCGQHTCQMPCGHPGRCHDCVVGVSFDELTCHCGETVMYPPIPCGTRPPICTFPCQRSLPCGHATLSEHHCHLDSEPCPPCVVFVERQCACGKKTMKNIPCSRQGVPSCGTNCQREIPSCGHRCSRFCHAGDCVGPDHPCTTRCGRVRSVCGHVCGFPCHGARFCAEDRPCKAQVTRSCECGELKIEVPCMAWKENMGNQPLTVLPCNDNCERVKRNRKLAEAFNIDTSLSTAPSGPTVEYSEALIRHAHANPSWVKSTEEALAAFVEDSAKRMFHFPSGKTAGNPQLLELAKHYDLAASIIDADRKGLASVTVRKTAAKAASIPSVLLSAAAASWKPGSSASLPSSSKLAKASTSSIRESINALHVTSLQGGMELRDLHLLLEPVFCGGYVTISVRKLGDHDAVVIVSAEVSRNLGNSTNGTNSNSSATAITGAATSRLAADDIENLLVGVEPEVRAKFVGNNWAKDVTLCHISPTTGEVVLGSRPQKTMGPGAARAAYNDAVRKDVVVSNAFTSLSATVAGGGAGPSSSLSRPPAASGVGASTVVSGAVAPQSTPSQPVLPRAPTPEAWDQDSSLLSPVSDDGES